VPEDLMARAGRALAAAPGAWYVQQLLVEDVAVGVLALGACDGAPLPSVELLARLIGDLLAAGLERLVFARMHSASMAHADAELHAKTTRLAMAVARLEELDKIKSNFLATVSHELRTPLTSVIGYSEMLLEGLAGPLNPEQREYVTTVMEKGEQLLS